MNLIEEYEAGLINFEEFEKYIWGCCQRLINEVGIDKFIFYLNAREGEFYEEE